MMRQIFLDTETTGREVAEGHRVIEIGAVEVIGRRHTGNRFHTYLNPEREVEAGATAVHGFTWDDLKDKPLFGERAEAFLDFIRGAELVIHNAPFDLGFLNRELERVGLPPMGAYCPQVVDSLKLARTLHPGKRNSLDALCDRYGIDNAGRILHGALLDAELLADMYLAMTRGQEALDVDLGGAGAASVALPADRPALRVIRCNEAELAAHEASLDMVTKKSGGACLWPRAQASSS